MSEQPTEDEHVVDTDFEDQTAPNVENGASSLPTVDEIKNNNSVSDQDKEKRATCVWGCIGMLMMVAIIGTLGGIIADQNDQIEGHNAMKSDTSSSYNPNKIYENGRHADLNAVQDYLLANGVSGVDTLYSETSYQYQAANWIANSDDADLPVPTHVTIEQTEGYMYIFRYIMALNYFALNGPTWSRHCQFLSEKNVCEWNDDMQEISLGVSCEKNLPVALNFDNNYLQGHIPTENGLLISLTQYKMSNNRLAGSIPNEICGMENLSELSLQNNQLVGNIPDCFEKLQFKLNSLELGYNALVGPIPASFAKLIRLKKLDVSHNELVGEAGQIWNSMAELTSLLAGSNRLEGNIDLTFLRSLQSLNHLDLSFNRFRLSGGEFPAHFFNGALDSLEILNLASNELKGTLPEILQNDKLRILSFYDNKMSGQMPGSLVDLQALEHLDLSKNEFEGSLPGLGSSMAALKFLSLGRNPFMDAGPVPDSYAQLTLEFLSLRDTNRNGALPDFIANMNDLEYLDLSMNDFSGDFPAAYLELSNVEVMLLNGNLKVGGEIGLGITARMDNAVAILLDGMNITGNLNQLCPSEDSVMRDFIFADCQGDTPTIQCVCCECCAPGNFGCSQDAVAELDDAIHVGYQNSDLLFLSDSTTEELMNPDMVP